MARLIVFPPWQSFENAQEVVRQWCRELHPTPVTRMYECEPPRVQKRAVQALHGSKIARDPPAHPPVHRVPNDRMSDRAEVYANLVCAAGMNGHLAQGQAAQVMGPCDSRDGLSRVPGPRGHFLAVHRIASDCSVYPPARLHHAPHERHVFLFDLAIVELPGKLLVRSVILGNHHHTGRTAIQPVHDPGSHLTANAAQILDVVEQRVHERARCMAGSRVHDHPGGLVQHRNVTVLIEDLERKRFASDSGRLGRRQIDGHLIAVVHREIRAGSAPGDIHVPVGNEFLNLRPRIALEKRYEEQIESAPIEIRRDNELERHT